MSRPAEPTAAEIEAAADSMIADGWLFTDSVDWRDHIASALAAAYAIHDAAVDARLREQIAAEIEASPREGQYAPDWHAAGRRAAKIARGL